LRLKLGRVFVDLTDSGKLFPTVEPATEKAQSPNLVRICGTMYYSAELMELCHSTSVTV